MANRLYLGLVLLVLLLLVLLGGRWFVQNFERHSEEVRSGFSSAALRNPWLAAERFLQRLGMQVESLAGREYLLSPPLQSGVLLVRDLGPSLSPQRQQRLLEWVENGGHLIIAPGRLADSDAPSNRLLEHLGVTLQALDTAEQGEQAGPVTVELPGSAESIEVDFDHARALHLEEMTADWQVPAASGYHLLRFSHGAGAITLLSSNQFLSNREIDERDHALLLARLVQDAPRGWLLYSSQMPSLLELSWRHAPYLLLSTGLLLLALLWRLTRRSGPLLGQPDAQRRDLLEHLQAAAEFLWQQERAAALQARTRRQLEKRWLRSHPLLVRLDQPARSDWLAQRTGLPREQIHQALYHVHTEERDLIRCSDVLQRLNTALHPDKTME